MLAEVAAAAHRLAACQQTVRVARAERDGAIRRALLAGAPIGSVAAAAGITRQAVHLITHSARQRAAPRASRPRERLERFSRRTRQAMVLAQDEARALGEPEIGPEHLLLGLFREGVAVRVHDEATEHGQLGEERPVRLRIEALRARLRPPRPRPLKLPPGRLPFSEAAALTLELALEQALSIGHQRIEPEHVLLALLEDPSGLAASVLAELEVDASALRAATMARYPSRTRQRSE
jgi:ATP-dependent Clp protease ATP-binding subunit ClpA